MVNRSIASFTPGFYLSKVYNDRRVEIMPNITADAVATINEKARLAKFLNELYPVDRLSDGSANRHVVTESFNRIHAVTGYSAERASCPMVDNSFNRAGLANEWVSDRHRLIFRQICSEMMGFAEDAVPLLEGRSTGPPLAIKAAKNRYLLWRHIHDHIDSIKAVFSSGLDADGLYSLAHDYALMLCSFTVFRDQPDNSVLKDGQLKPKQRFAPDIAFSLSGGVRGSDHAVSSVIEELRDLPCYRMRRREAFGVSGSANMVLFFFRMMQSHLLKNFEPLYHIRTTADLDRPLLEYPFVCGCDFQHFDLKTPIFFYDEIRDGLRNHICSEIVDLWYRVITGAVLLTGLTRHKEDNGWLGDPFDPRTFIFHGNLSGIASTSYTNKLIGFAIACFIIDDFYHNLLEVGVTTTALHQHPNVAIINNGDDLLIYTNDQKFYDHLDLLQREGRLSPYFEITFEPIAVFGGKTLTSYGGRRAFLSSSNSFFKNRLAPERGWRSNRNGLYYDIALRSLPVVYGDNPDIVDLLAILSDFLQRLCGRTLKQLGDELSIDNRRERSRLGLPEPTLESLSDAMFYLEPDRLSWQFAVNEVSAEARKAFALTIPVDEAMKALQRIRA